ncbi:MAG TPA: OmpA family protein, partial [Anaeromyxobacteraceae bacterium]
LAYTRTGTAIAFSGGAAYRWHEFRAGPEVYGRHQFDGTSTSPVEALVGGHWQHDALDVGAAVGTTFDRAPGASPLRVILQATWRPASQAPAAALPTAEPAAKPAPQPEATPTVPAPVVPQEKPAPAPAPPEVAPQPPVSPPLAVKSGKSIELHEAVQFEVDRDVLRAESEPLLRQVAAVLIENPEITKLVIEGHTDSSGRPAKNLALSQRRAEAVRRWLVERGGIDAGRLEAKGFGSARPVTSNATAAGRVRNRRVELRIAAEHEEAGSR